MLDKPEYPCDKCDLRKSCSTMCYEWGIWFFYNWRTSTARLRRKKPNLNECEARYFASNLSRHIAESKKESGAEKKK